MFDVALRWLLTWKVTYSLIWWSAFIFRLVFPTVFYNYDEFIPNWTHLFILYALIVFPLWIQRLYYKRRHFFSNDNIVVARSFTCCPFELWQMSAIQRNDCAKICSKQPATNFHDNRIYFNRNLFWRTDLRIFAHFSYFYVAKSSMWLESPVKIGFFYASMWMPIFRYSDKPNQLPSGWNVKIWYTFGIHIEEYNLNMQCKWWHCHSVSVQFKLVETSSSEMVFGWISPKVIICSAFARSLPSGFLCTDIFPWRMQFVIQSFHIQSTFYCTKHAIFM